MIGKFIPKIFILLISYMLICAFIHLISYYSLTKKIFLDVPGFRAIQKNLYKLLKSNIFKIENI